MTTPLPAAQIALARRLAMPVVPDTVSAALHPISDPRPLPAARLVPPAGDTMLDAFRRATVTMVASDGPDLTARQLGVLLVVYLEDGPHTVRGLAALLNVARPAITRAIDRLEALRLAKRNPDPTDRRSVVVVTTREGRRYLDNLRRVLADAHAAALANAGE